MTDAGTGSAVAGVTVSAGNLSTTTDAAGDYTLEGIAPSARVVLNFARSSYVPQTRSSESLGAGGASAVVNVPLLAVGTSDTFNPNTARTISVANSTAQVQLPANALRRADGSAPQGLVTARVTPIASANNVSYMPGNYLALSGDSTAPIESFGALDASFVDSTGAPLNLASGISATIRIPLSARGTAPSSVPLFYFDAASGLWVQDGTATLANSGTAQYFEGTVSRFAIWNADQVYNTVQIKGGVQDAAGTRVAGAVVRSEGRNYVGGASASTNANGEFSVAVKRTADAYLQAFAGTHPSNALPQSIGSSDVTLSDCLTLTPAAMGVKLTWGAMPRDLDAYTLTADGDYVAFRRTGSLAAAPFVALDVHGNSGYGPEVMTFAKLAKNRTYRYFVHNYSASIFGAGQISPLARVEITLRGVPTVFVPPEGENSSTRFWHVFDVRTNDSCMPTILPVQQLLAKEPINVNPTAAAEYCN